MFGNSVQNPTGLKINLIRPVNWIVSYPRSGSTYLRTLLANYASESFSPLSLEEIIQSTSGEHVENIYFELTGKQAANRSLAEEMRARVAYFDRIRQSTSPAMPMIKSHFVHGTVAGHPTFRFVPGDRIVQLIRHPCDVAISVSHYYNIDIDAAIDQLLRNDTMFNGAPLAGYEVIGSWFQHTRSWLQPMEVPMFRTRYGDLVTRTEEVLTELIAFLGFQPNQARIQRAIEFSGFERLKAQERQSGFRETLSQTNGGYFRDGRSDQWLERLTIRQAQRLLDHDPEIIDALGFQKVLLTETKP